jgi:membrane protein
VPLVTVMLAVFSAFPMFASFRARFEKYFLQSLVPDTIAKPVLGRTQFAAKAPASARSAWWCWCSPLWP